MRIVVIGAGPTGLGAAYRLQELGFSDWDLYEASDHIGGLAASHTDRQGFTYDIGGHVLFSHYPYFDDLVDRMLGDRFVQMRRESWIRTGGRYVPYPYQSNIRYLSNDDIVACIMGLIKAQRSSDPAQAGNFAEWIDAQFGEGIAQKFMIPYNVKVWAHPLKMMSKQWIAERVALVDIEHILRNVLKEQDDVQWGPNSTFKFPLRGGTGGLFEGFKPYVESHLHLNSRVTAIDPSRKVVEFANGSHTDYDVLISSMPINLLVDSLETCPVSVRTAAQRLCWSSGLFVGVGISRPCPSDKCWLYFPDAEVPFYRVTYLSNYSPYIAPDDKHFLLLTETSYSPYRPQDRGTIVSRTIDGLIATGILDRADRSRIVATDLTDIKYSYPIPTVDRDAALADVQPYLMENAIYSRGRFGAWLYEIGNMDHSVMQGVEVVNRVLCGEEGSTWFCRAGGAVLAGAR